MIYALPSVGPDRAPAARIRARRRPHVDLSALTGCELQVYRLTMEGGTVSEISAALGIHEWKVQAARGVIRTKGVHLPRFQLSPKPGWTMVKAIGRDARGRYRAVISRDRDDAIAAFNRCGGRIERMEILS